MENQHGLKIFGSNIRKLRENKKLTQAELAELMGFSPNFVGMIERGERNTTVSNIFKFAKALNVQAMELLKE